MEMKGKESICQIKGTVGSDNKALEVNMTAIPRAEQSCFTLFPPSEAELSERKPDSSRKPRERGSPEGPARVKYPNRL